MLLGAFSKRKALPSRGPLWALWNFAKVRWQLYCPQSQCPRVMFWAGQGDVAIVTQQHCTYSWTIVQKLYSSGPQLWQFVCGGQSAAACLVMQSVHWLHPGHYFISSAPQIQELARNPYHCPHSISSPFVHPLTYMPPLIGFLNLNIDTVIITKYSEKDPPFMLYTICQ